MFLGSYMLPKGPLYDPKSTIKNFVHDEDFNNITLIAIRHGVLYSESRPLPDLGANIEWKRPKEICKRPYFINGKPDRFDALQGILGDCWLVIAMEGLTFDEDLFNFVVPENQGFDWRYTGAFHFRFWQLGVWYDVVVDDRLPVYKSNQKLCYVRSKSGNVFWAALLEKAYCKMCGRKESGYAALEDGRPNTAFQDFTGGLIEFIYPKEPPSGRPLRWFLYEVFLKRAFLGCIIMEEPKDKSTNRGLDAIHGYLISGIFYNKDDDPENPGLCLVRILNPWGRDEWTGAWSDKDVDKWKGIDRNNRKNMEFKIEDDGEFWMSEFDLAKYFSVIFICHLGPGQYLYSHSTETVPTWSTTTFRGEWVKDVSAGGRFKENRHINPQYKILLKSLQNDTNEDALGPVTVVIEVTQRSLLSRKFWPSVGFYVYYLSNLKGQQDHLGEDFFRTNTEKNDMDITMSDGRGYVESLKLVPGWYCIVPFTANEGEESSFLLRIFTESNVEHWEYDTKVSKTPYFKEETEEKIEYDELKHCFDEAAQHEELDWIGLKDIFKRHSNALTRTSSMQPTKGLKNEDIVFSKDECRSMIAMLDVDDSGKLNYYEFCSLWKKLHFWLKVYDSFRDRQGFMKVNKLRDAISSIGFNLNKKVIHRLVHVHANENGEIMLTDFILCGVVLNNMFTRFENYNNIKESVNFKLNDWVKITLAG